MKISTADWLAATVIAALFLFPLWLPHAPICVQVPIVILVIVGGFLFAVSALRNGWRLSKSTGRFSVIISALLQLPS